MREQRSMSEKLARRREENGSADSDMLEVSAWSVAASVGTVLLVGLAGLALYVVGTVIVFEGFNEPGRWTSLAAAYLLLAVVVPIAIARKMRRSRRWTWRRVGFVCALIVLVVSVLFFPYASFVMVFWA